MSDFADMVARAVSPTMSRAEREAVYRAAKAAVLRLQAGDARAATDPTIVLQQHLVEETIRDLEVEIARYLALGDGGAATSPAGLPKG